MYRFRSYPTGKRLQTMPYETIVSEAQRPDSVAAAEPQVLGIQAAIEQVRTDSQKTPEEYLDESTVPHGGE